MERAEEQLSRDLNEGRISQTDYNAEMRELQRDARAAYEEDMRDAQERVRDEWGY
jgi:hypothetical protein